jgi:hypothetical protein
MLEEPLDLKKLEIILVVVALVPPTDHAVYYSKVDCNVEDLHSMVGYTQPRLLDGLPLDRLGFWIFVVKDWRLFSQFEEFRRSKGSR